MSKNSWNISRYIISLSFVILALLMIFSNWFQERINSRVIALLIIAYTPWLSKYIKSFEGFSVKAELINEEQKKEIDAKVKEIKEIKLDKKKMVANDVEIDKTKQTIKNYVDSPITLIRVPYGSRNKKVDMVLEKLNLTDILWDVDSKDWKLKNTTKVYNYTIKCIKGNNIILMHDTFKTSIEAAIKLVDSLSSNGYIFVNVSTLLEFKE